MQKLNTGQQHWLPIIKGYIHLNEDMLQGRKDIPRKWLQQLIENEKIRVQRDFYRNTLSKSLKVKVEHLAKGVLLHVTVERKKSEVNNTYKSSYFSVDYIDDNCVLLTTHNTRYGYYDQYKGGSRKYTHDVDRGLCQKKKLQSA